MRINEVSGVDRDTLGGNERHLSGVATVGAFSRWPFKVLKGREAESWASRCNSGLTSL